MEEFDVGQCVPKCAHCKRAITDVEWRRHFHDEAIVLGHGQRLVWHCGCDGAERMELHCEAWGSDTRIVPRLADSPWSEKRVTDPNALAGQKPTQEQVTEWPWLPVKSPKSYRMSIPVALAYEERAPSISGEWASEPLVVTKEPLRTALNDATTPHEWCRCGCGGEGRCLAGTRYGIDSVDSDVVLAVMRMPLK